MDIFTCWQDVGIWSGFCWLTIGSCVHGDGPSGSRKGRAFLDYQLLKIDCRFMPGCHTELPTDVKATYRDHL
jgi:hypothetical protein